MNSQVFQLHTEQRKKGQFQDTINQLLTYAATNYAKEIKHLKIIFTDLEEPTIEAPQPPSTRRALSSLEETILAEETKQYIKDKRNLNTAMASLYSVVWGQCSRLMQHKLKALKNYQKMNTSNDLVQLLKEIKILGNKIEENTSIYEALHDAKTRLFLYKQKEDESLADHVRNFKDLVGTIEHYGGDVFYDKQLAQHETDQDKEHGRKTLTAIQYKERVIDKNKAIRLLKTACQKRYGRLMQNIRDQYSFKIDVYPNNITDAYKLLSSYHNSIPSSKKNDNSNSTKQNNNKGTDKKNNDTSDVGMSYLQDGGIPGTDGRFISHITCYRCGRKGHYADNCPEDEVKQGQQHMQSQRCQEISEEQESGETQSHRGDQHFQVNSDEEMSDDSNFVHFQWAQVGLNQLQGNRKNTYKDTDILIDTGSTFSVFKNPKMLLNIRKSTKPLNAITNGGKQTSEYTGDLPGFFSVWFNPNSMLNILAWSDVRKRYRITVDTDKGAYIEVHLDKDKRMYFEEVRSGLYLFRGSTNGGVNSNINGYSFLTLTKGEPADFTHTQIQKAKDAKRLYQRIGYPGYTKIFWLVQNKKIRGCQVDMEDVKRAIHLYGPDIAVLRGRSVGTKSHKINKPEVIELPKEILQKNINVHLYIDYMYVHGMPFLTTVSSVFNFRTVEPLMSKRRANFEDMLQGVQRVLNLYHSRGLKVAQIAADNEFECLRDHIRPIMLNVVAADEHVSEIERSI